MTDSKTRIENCMTALVAFVKTQTNHDLPGRLVNPRDWDQETKTFIPWPAKATKGSMVPDEDGGWNSDVWTNINADRWEDQIGSPLGLDEEEFVDRCTQIARCFGCGVSVSEDYRKLKNVVRISLWS